MKYQMKRALGISTMTKLLVWVNKNLLSSGEIDQTKITGVEATSQALVLMSWYVYETAVDSVLSGITDKSKYMKDIPFSPEANQRQMKICRGLLRFGNIYKEKMDDPMHAIGAFRNLLSALRYIKISNQLPLSIVSDVPK